MKSKEKQSILAFTKKEKRGILLILFVNLIICFLPTIYHTYFQQKQIGSLSVKIDSSEIKEQQLIVDGSMDKSVSIQTEVEIVAKVPTPVYKPFNPNDISTAEWMQMGVKEKTALSIQKYISKGGRFRTAADIRKIWGLSEVQKNQLEPFVNIPSETVSTFKNHQPLKEKQVENIDLNKADSAQLEMLPGIGPALARRIVLYRKKLGGFYATEQLSEVWGLPDSIYQKIKNKCTIHEEIIKIDINLVEFDALKSHPYFGYKLANAIINYRKQHGKFIQLEDIQQIIQIDKKTYNKILPYLYVSK